MRWRRQSPTRRLSTARLEFTTDRRLHDRLVGAALAALVTAGLALAGWQYANGRLPVVRVAQLERENAALRAELARARTDLEIERSTRAALTDQVADLNRRAADLRSQVEFFNSQSGRGARPR